MAWLRWRICFQDGALMWLLAGDLSSSLCGPSLRVSDPAEREGAQDGSHSLFYNLTLEVAYDHFFQILLVTEPNTGAVSEEIAHWGSS